MKNSTLIWYIFICIFCSVFFYLYLSTMIILFITLFSLYLMMCFIESTGESTIIYDKYNILIVIAKLYSKFVKYVDSKEPIIKIKSKNFNHKFECYEIHTVQARMYGCNTQCNECKVHQEYQNKTKKSIKIS